MTKASPWHHGDICHGDITETPPKRPLKHHRNISKALRKQDGEINMDTTETTPRRPPKTSSRHPRDISKALKNKTETSPWTPPRTSPKQHKTKTDTSRRQDRDMTESMNFSILKHHPSTYGSTATLVLPQRCTIYKFKIEFWILLRIPIKNVHQCSSPNNQKHHHQRNKKQHCNINETNTKPSTHSSSKHHSTITTHPRRTSPKHARDITNTSLKDPQSTKTPTKHHKTTPKHHQQENRDKTKTNPRQDQDKTETRPRHDRDITETTPKQHRDITKKRQRQDRDTTESMNFSILKLSPSTYEPQLHWFAQRCTIDKFKSEFEILLRNPIKMFINVHHQTIKTPSPKK